MKIFEEQGQFVFRFFVQVCFLYNEVFFCLFSLFYVFFMFFRWFQVGRNVDSQVVQVGDVEVVFFRRVSFFWGLVLVFGYYCIKQGYRVEICVCDRDNFFVVDYKQLYLVFQIRLEKLIMGLVNQINFDFFCGEIV